MRSSLPLALAATLGALVLGGCGGSSPATKSASADAGGATTASTATTSAGTTGTSAAADGAGAKRGGTSTSGGSKAASGGGKAGTGSSAKDDVQAHGGSGNGSASGGSSSGGGSKSGGSKGGGFAADGSHGASKPGDRKNVSAKTGAGDTSTDTSAGTSTPTSTGAGAPSASTGVPYEVSTISMRPNYQPETKIYYDPTRTNPQIGEVIVFYLPTGAAEGECRQVAVGGAPCAVSVPGLTKVLAIKRVVGLPGDTIEIHDGHVIRDGQSEPEPPTLPCKEEEEGCNYAKAIVVPAGYYYVMGDNRRLPQEDSRVFGAIPQEAIVGTVEGG
jgi:signal peptidase I